MDSDCLYVTENYYLISFQVDGSVSVVAEKQLLARSVLGGEVKVRSGKETYSGMVEGIGK